LTPKPADLVVLELFLAELSRKLVVGQRFKVLIDSNLNLLFRFAGHSAPIRIFNGSDFVHKLVEKQEQPRCIFSWFKGGVTMPGNGEEPVPQVKARRTSIDDVSHLELINKTPQRLSVGDCEFTDFPVTNQP
jgi:hypothetical protein